MNISHIRDLLHSAIDEILDEADNKLKPAGDIINIVILDVDEVNHKIEYCYAKYYGQSNCRHYTYNVPPQLRNDEFYEQFVPDMIYEVVNLTTEKGGWLWTSVELVREG